MMALKCDNCGGYFDFGKDKDSNGIDFVHMHENRSVVLIDRKSLCPACLASVVKALKDRKEAANTYEGVKM